MRNVPSFSHFLDKEEKFKFNFTRLGVFYTENKCKMLIEPLVLMREKAKTFLSEILLEQLLKLDSKQEINQLIKQSFFLLTKLRMRYFVLDNYWKLI